jgi:tRNA 5-methylaminomethyl-2-thiouridine biosynthesis bifunctional protein
MTEEPSPYQLPPALLDWDAAGAPHSREFGDIYFSRESGSAETDYVFLQQNRLAERWRALDPHRPGVFTIGETGFGTGLNFLAAWQLWRETAPRGWRLHFVSAEQFPLTRAQLAQALAVWPQFADPGAALLAAYPPCVRGFHLRQLPGDITLQLLFDDAADAFDALCDSTASLPNGFGIDAWFLDGFAPAKNPGMWTPALFAALARLSRPGSTFATFTAAGIVRRGLREVGFATEKVEGFGSKREMLRGLFVETAVAQLPAIESRQTPPAVDYWARPPAPHRHQRVVVIGGGLAGASTAHALARRGWSVALLEAGATLAGGASGNPQGMLYTRLSAERGTLARFALASYLHALDHYRQLQRDGTLPDDSARWSGVLQFETDPRLRTVFSEQGDWVRPVTAAEAAELAGIPIGQDALWFARAGWLRPARLCAALADHPLIDVQLDTAVTGMTREGDTWRIATARGDLLAGIVVIATASDATALAPTAGLPLRPIRGQITAVPAAGIATQPRCVICHDGYLAPENDGGLTIGATFDQRDRDAGLRSEDHRRNLQALRDALPGLLRDEVFQQLDALPGRVGFRCTTPDYLPIVGAVADTPLLRERFAPLARNARSRVTADSAWLPGLYVNVGHGSRGLTSTPICAELLAALIVGEPRPLPRSLQHALSPARFAIRDLIRGAR